MLITWWKRRKHGMKYVPKAAIIAASGSRADWYRKYWFQYAAAKFYLKLGGGYQPYRYLCRAFTYSTIGWLPRNYKSCQITSTSNQPENSNERSSSNSENASTLLLNVTTSVLKLGSAHGKTL